MIYLDGKGSKHHGAANLTLLMWYKRQCSEIDDFQVMTVSADGPVSQWRKKLYLED